MKKVECRIVHDQGPRARQEDSYALISSCDGTWIFGGVYDGHGEKGDEAAEYASSVMGRRFLDMILAGMDPGNAFQFAYKLTSDEIPMDHHSGACAADFFLRQGTIYSANAGDSEIIVVRRDSYVRLTETHRVGVDKEDERVLFSKGILNRGYMFYMSGGPGIAVTRSLGDYYFKQRGALSIPFLRTYTLQRDDRFLVAGTDGLFDPIDPDELAQEMGKADSVEETENLIREEVVDWMAAEGKGDNVTAIIIDTRHL